MPMTSFQVEIAPSSSSFFQKNLDLTDLWVHQPQWQATSSSTAPTTTTTTTTTYANINNYDDGEEAQKPKLDKWARAREIVFPGSGSTSPKEKQDMMNSSTEVSNSGGVSSLVQKWRGFETGAGGKPPPPPPPPGTLTNDDDSIIGDWESDRTVLSGRSSIRGRDSDATESERLRVADIIRKLTPNEAGSTVSPRTSLDHVDMSCCSRTSSGISITATTTSSHRVRTSLDHQTDIRSRPPIGSSPRIRGRQAYIDLLVQVERDRRKELQGLHARKPVSHFSHRGRIQAVLKLKFLRRAMEAKQSAGTQYSFEYSRSHKPRTSFDSKFCREEVVIKPKPQNAHESCPKDDNDIQNSNSVATTASTTCCRRDSQEEKDVCKTSSQEHKKTNIQHGYEENDNHEAIFTDWESSNICNRSLPKSAETSRAEAAKTSIHEEAAADDSAQHTCTAVEAYWVSSSTADHIDDTSNSHPDEYEGWEELHSDYQTKETNNRDWIDEVSRPRSDWEYLRQARYQEMLDPFMDKEDIRALLGRKSVSNFLSSDMRDKIDQLMISRTQGPQNVNSNNQRHGQVGKQGRADQEEYGEYCDAYEEAESSVGQHYTDCDEYINLSPSASLDPVAASWPPENQNQINQTNNNNNNQLGRESSECSYQEVSPSTQQSSTNYCSQDMMTGRSSSYNNHPSIEMELIYDLRRHMEQLHQEISELRKSIKCSTDMQMKLHRSIKKEVTAALTHPDAKNGRRHPVKKSSTANVRRCSVCCKVQVDCVLYRCGHMCTCFECAHELHWSSGRCPICRAQIVDVVRIHSNF